MCGWIGNGMSGFTPSRASMLRNHAVVIRPVALGREDIAAYRGVLAQLAKRPQLAACAHRLIATTDSD